MMGKLHYFFVLILSFMLSTNSSAFSWGRISYYTCSNYEDAMACNKRCENIDREGEFKVNEKTNVIIQVDYVSGKTVHSSTLNNCQIADKNNWECNSSIENGYIQTQDKMLNGRYFHQDSVPKLKKSSFLCGK